MPHSVRSHLQRVEIDEHVASMGRLTQAHVAVIEMAAHVPVECV